MKHREVYYTEPKNISKDEIEITGQELKHISRVLRKRARDIIEVVDGQGNLYTAVLTKISKESAKAEIQKKTRFVNEPNFKLTIAHAIPKRKRFDLVIEKGTEIGASTFIPLLCENSNVNEVSSRLNRWKKIAIAAMKQSARSVLPEILPPHTIQDIVRNQGLLKLGFIAEMGENSKSLSSIIAELNQKGTPLKSAIMLIGPEGGFSAKEVKLATDNGFHRFSLGPRRLRSETAGIAASAILMEMVGEMG